ncbi:MAG TPA: hypothetical protein VMV46_02870 [Thermoanaerobaculia bacterium]|nr:hypothetical protein [Thermoanaerobaculia bacterium]
MADEASRGVDLATSDPTVSSPARFARLKQLFEQAARLEPSERTAFVAAATEEQPALGHELERLLAQDFDGTGFEEVQDAIADALAGEGDGDSGRRPEVVGPYRILRLLGRVAWGRSTRPSSASRFGAGWRSS